MKRASDIESLKVQVGEIDLSKPLDLVVLGIKKGEAARCRLVGEDKELTLRASGLWNVAAGEIVTVAPKKHWSYAGHPYLSAEIAGSRLDLAALDLTPLKLSSLGTWDPAEEYWGDRDEPESGTCRWDRTSRASSPGVSSTTAPTFAASTATGYASGNSSASTKRRPSSAACSG